MTHRIAVLKPDYHYTGTDVPFDKSVAAIMALLRQHKCERIGLMYETVGGVEAATLVFQKDGLPYRIVLAGYFDEHSCLLSEGWTMHRWSAHGGFANRGNGKSQGEINRHKEALFFSPHCHSSGLKRFEDAGILQEVSA